MAGPTATLLGKLRPNGDTKAQWTEEPVGTAYTTLDEVVDDPTVPTLTDYITSSTSGQVCTVEMGTATLGAGQAVSQIILRVYGETSGATVTPVLQTSASKSVTSAPVTAAAAWYIPSNAKRVPGLTQSEIDGLQVTIPSGASGTATIYAVYISFYVRGIEGGTMTGVW